MSCTNLTEYKWSFKIRPKKKNCIAVTRPTVKFCPTLDFSTTTTTQIEENGQEKKGRKNINNIDVRNLSMGFAATAQRQARRDA